jgi:hypothetical protein
MNVYLAGKLVRVSPAQLLGRGGEAEVYDIGTALKLYKPPEHADFTGMPDQQQAARTRILEHQTKLRDFPKGLPRQVVAPQELATDRAGKVVLGYTMSLVRGAEPIMRYGEPAFRRTVGGGSVVKVFLELHEAVAALHRNGVVIGDFNDLNVLVKTAGISIVDADSFQFRSAARSYLSSVFTERFVDPLLCEASAPTPVLTKPHNELSDWYAFHALLFQSLLCVGPFGGIHRPKDAMKRIPPAARPLRRVTVLHPEVQYPKPAMPAESLPHDLLHHFDQTFARDARAALPRPLLEQLHFQTCSSCGREHARGSCPTCQPHAQATATRVVAARGRVSATTVFETRGEVVHTCLDGGDVRWLAWEGSSFVREDGKAVYGGPLRAGVTYAIRGPDTYLALGGEVVRVPSTVASQVYSVDTSQGRPVFGCNPAHIYWAHGGRLHRDAQLGPEIIGDVLQGQTRFWVGPTFGVGFYRAGAVSVGFTFDAEKRGLRDTVKLPAMPGQILDAACAINERRAWLFVATQLRGRLINYCVVLGRNGDVLGQLEAPANSNSWLANVHGRCAAGDLLLCPTDDGVIRVELQNGAPTETRVFSDAEPFVDASCSLIAAARGLCVVSPKKIVALTFH